MGVPRKPREDVAGAVHHVFARGNNKRRIYLDDVDRRRYLALLGHVVEVTRWRCLAYCLLDNHVHLLVETRKANLGSGVQLLHGLYAAGHNRRHSTSGHVFQGRFGATRVTSDAQFWVTARYIARNPVEAALCARAEHWAWGSHAAIVTPGARPLWLDADRLFSYFAAFGGDRRRRYLDAVS
jgi:putative transposase